MANQELGVAYSTFVTKDKQYVKVPDIKRWLREWTAMYGPPREARIHPSLIRLSETITMYSPTTNVIVGHGPLAFELHLGPVPTPTYTMQSENKNG